MNLVAYQYSLSQDFHAFLSSQNIYPTHYYQDHLESRPEFQQYLEDCEQQPSNVLVIPGIDDLAFTLDEVQTSLEQLWERQITVLVMTSHSLDIQATVPLALIPADWPSQGLPKLGNLPPTQRVQPQDWIRLGSILEKRRRKHDAEKGHHAIRLKQAPPTGQAPYGYRRGKNSYLVDRVLLQLSRDSMSIFCCMAALEARCVLWPAPTVKIFLSRLENDGSHTPSIEVIFAIKGCTSSPIPILHCYRNSRRHKSIAC
ncbi:MAG: recombinase family protein [Acaryochloridaceae cyanobacterium RL_2_7]|nr:recombinase family protein [Acaryochloridaceae cyanobacterium RL_2_7]